MAYYKMCSGCGAHLDPGEVCRDCKPRMGFDRPPEKMGYEAQPMDCVTCRFGYKGDRSCGMGRHIKDAGEYGCSRGLGLAPKGIGKGAAQGKQLPMQFLGDDHAGAE